MTDTPTQVGTALMIGLGSYTFTGTIVEDGTLGNDATVEETTDENGNTVNKTVCNKKTTLSLSAIIKGTGFVQPVKGDVVTINTVKYFCESSEVSMSKSPKANKWSFKGVKEASMTYA